MQKILHIFFNSVPILIMIGLIPVVKNDYLLTLLYLVIITLSLYIKKTKKDVVIMFIGFVFMMISEYLFVSTGVETFVRNSLFGFMPIWLPFLWAYGFVVISRITDIIR